MHVVDVLLQAVAGAKSTVAVIADVVVLAVAVALALALALAALALRMLGYPMLAQGLFIRELTAATAPWHSYVCVCVL